ncbi:MAG: DsrE family protein [Gammaproteobacteria bacterium]|jgi:intracellular sulfur oxidation DsrE/DsrF family protein
MDKKVIALIGGVLLCFSSVNALAHGGHGNDFNNSENCVGTPFIDADGNPVSFDTRFGNGTPGDVSGSTRCLENTERVKVLYQINTECKNSACDAPYAVGNIKNAIKDYEMTHGMRADDYKIAVVVHSGGWKLVLNDAAKNKFKEDMEWLVSQPSVKVMFCLNTANSKGVKKADMIDGIGFVTSGVTAIPDLQEEGYRYVQP